MPIGIAIAAVLGAVVGGATAGYQPVGAAPSTTTVVVVAATKHRDVRAARAATAPAGHRPWIRTKMLERGVAEIKRSTGAQVGVAVRELSTGQLVTAGSYQSADAWSTIKVPIVMSAYRLAESGQASEGSIAPLASAAITASDNAAAAALFSMIEGREGGVIGASRYVQRELEAAGDHTTTITTVEPGYGFSTYGQTQWSLSLGTQFFRSLAKHCIPPADQTLHVLGLMSEVEPDQRWGVGSTSWKGATLIRFKGGWGPEVSDHLYVVRQFGVIEDGDRRGFVVGLLAKPRDGQFTSGTEVLDQLAALLARSTVFSRTAPASACS